MPSFLYSTYLCCKHIITNPRSFIHITVCTYLREIAVLCIMLQDISLFLLVFVVWLSRVCTISYCYEYPMDILQPRLSLVPNYFFKLPTFPSHQNFPTHTNFQLFRHIVPISTKLSILTWTKHTPNGVLSSKRSFQLRYGDMMASGASPINGLELNQIPHVSPKILETYVLP